MCVRYLFLFLGAFYLCFAWAQEAQPVVSGPGPASSEQPQASLIGTPPAQAHTCIACHGLDGNSTVPAWPKLAGQHKEYLVKQLQEFRKGEKGNRYEPSMSAMAAPLTDEDIIELSTFYASQKPTLGKAQKASLEMGEKIYRGGVQQSGIPACAACHGIQGQGFDAAKFPRLSGQHAQYIEDQLHAFQTGKRKNSPNEMMEDIAHHLTEEQIKAVSNYIEGLR